LSTQKGKRVSLEDEFAYILEMSHIPYERQYRAIPNRRFRYDFFIPPDVLVEIQGGIYQYNPSHTSASGIRRDCEKVNLAGVNGYKILLFTSDMVRSGEALEIVESVRR